MRRLGRTLFSYNLVMRFPTRATLFFATISAELRAAVDKPTVPGRSFWPMSLLHTSIYAAIRE